MKYPVLTQEQIDQQRGTLNPGIVDFEISTAEEKTSKSTGNPMIELVIKVWDSAGHEGQVWDYLTGNAQWKIKHLYESIGEAEKYESGEIVPLDLVGKTGKANLVIQKDRTGQYGDKPKIKDYITLDADEPKNNGKEPPKFDEEFDIQF